MPGKVLFVQGGGEGAHRVDARLTANLREELGPAYQVRYPEMPDEASPDYAAWAGRLAGEIAALGSDAILVGHSVGAAVLIAFLAEAAPERRPAGIFLIAAPFIGNGGWQTGDFAAFDDVGARLPEDVPVYLYHGRDDESVPFAHVELYALALPRAIVRRLGGRNHQLN